MARLSKKYCFLVFALPLLVACPNREKIGDCTSDKDCSGEKSHCLQNECVECVRDDHCDCHNICEQNACVPFGASSVDKTLHAHGTWTGTPGQPDYAHTGSCIVNGAAADALCPIGQICNGLTGGCVNAADYTRSCFGINPCQDVGPNGEVLACDKARNKCLPAALCRAGTLAQEINHHCCGLPNLVCDSSQLCVQRINECEPPDASSLTSTCPFLPRVIDSCAPGQFCSLSGRCVQCGCDADCGDSSLHCDDGTCRPEGFCTTAGQCPPGQSCDTHPGVNQCRPRCEDDNSCSAVDYCEPNDHVCRPRTELPCAADSFDASSNNTSEEALAQLNALPSLTLPIPALNSFEVVANLTVCSDDSEDWYTLVLNIGDRITLGGTSAAGLKATLTAFADDGETPISTGKIDPLISSNVDFVANYDGVYYVQVLPDLNSTGDYNLHIARELGVPCTDNFENTHGTNNIATAATPLNFDLQPNNPPTGCNLTAGTLASGHTVSCSGGTLKLCGGDVDYYLVHSHLGATANISLTNFAGDLDLYMYGPFFSGDTLTTSGTLVDSSQTSIIPEIVAAAVRPAGDFVIAVRRLTGPETAYDLAVTIVQAPACTEDAYDATTAATAGAPPLPTFVNDLAGLNDESTSASGIGLVAATTPGTEVVTVRTSLATPLNLCALDADWFVVGVENAGNLDPVPAGHRLVAQLSNVQLQSGDALTLAAGSDPANLTFGSSDTSSPTTAVVIAPTTASTTYYFAIFGKDTNQDVVQYELDLELQAPPTCPLDNFGDTGGASNNTPADAKLLDPVSGWPDSAGELHSQNNLTLCAQPALDDDWYVINIPPGTHAIATVAYNPAEAEIGLAAYNNSVLGVSNPPAGQPLTLGRVDLSTLDGQGIQRVRADFTGLAYFQIYNRTGWPLLNYELTVRLLSNVCGEDPFDLNPSTDNDQWDAATPIPLAPTLFDPQKQIGILDPMTLCTDVGGETDYYNVPLFAGDQITVDLYYSPSEGIPDLLFYAPGPAGLNAALDSDLTVLPTLNHKQVSYQVPQGGLSGAYLVRVHPHQGPFSNVYMLLTNVTRACIDDGLEPAYFSIPYALSIPPDPVVDATLKLCNDEDWFAIDTSGLGATTPLTVCARFSHAAGDIDLMAFNNVAGTLAATLSNGTFLEAQSTTKTDLEQLHFDAVPGTTYYLRVFLDPRDQANTSYRYWVLQGNVACPP